MKNQIKSFEDACKHLNIQANLPNVENLPEKHQKAIVAHYKLVIIIQVLNEGWEPDWKDFGQLKYFPWFDVVTSKESVSGVGLSYDDYAFTYSATTVGSRLCLKTSELARYVAEQFKELYEDYFLF